MKQRDLYVTLLALELLRVFKSSAVPWIFSSDLAFLILCFAIVFLWVYTLRHVLWQMGIIDKKVSSSCISVHSLSYTSSWRCSTAWLNAPKPFSVKLLRLCSVVLWQIIHLVKSVSLDNCLFITNTGSISISIYRSYSILVTFTTYSWGNLPPLLTIG